jgi:hypothetical protein
MEVSVLEKQYGEFLNYIEVYLSDRKVELKNMYDSFGNRLVLAPASSIDYYHNAFVGGYIDHVLRVIDTSIKLYEFYEQMNMDLSGFTKSNLVFVAMHHDLGKLGFIGEGNDKYIPNDSEWHRKNMGKVYKTNDNIPFALVPDLSIYTLQKFSVKIYWEEFIAIKIHDGLYEDGNKPYYIARSESASLRTNLAYIIHMADLMASKQEYKIWKNSKNKINTINEIKKESDSALNDFKQMFDNPKK